MVRTALARKHRECRLEILDCGLQVLGAVSARAVPVHDGQVVLQLSPLRWMGLAREHGQGRLEMGGCFLLVIDALPLNTGPVRHAEIVMCDGPVLAAQLFGSIAPRRSQDARWPSPDCRPAHRWRALGRRCRGQTDVSPPPPDLFIGHSLTWRSRATSCSPRLNPLFGGLRLLPPLQQCGEFCRLVLVGCARLRICAGWPPSESDHGKTTSNLTNLHMRDPNSEPTESNNQDLQLGATMARSMAQSAAGRRRICVQARIKAILRCRSCPRRKPHHFALFSCEKQEVQVAA